MQIPRYAPSREFPPYSYVSGMWPHPISDSRGHSYEHRLETVSLPMRSEWQSCEDYLFGVDLFNHGYYWEAHETWESLWHAAGRENVDADFFKGLIKLAAAGVKAREGRKDGVTRHLTRGSEILNSVQMRLAEDETMWGISFRPLLAQVDCWKRLPFVEQWTEIATLLKVWNENLLLIS